MAERSAVAADQHQHLGAWFDLSTDGTVILKTGKVELGQGILLALRQIAAEELDLPLAAVETISGDTAVSPFEAGTVGSMSIETSGVLVRRHAAELRHSLLDAAAMRLQAPRSDIGAIDGHFHLGDASTSETFWTVASDVAFSAPIPGPAATKPHAHYTLVGSSPPPTALLQRLGGGAYIHDIALDGMLYGRVLRKPHHDARLEAADLDSISAMQGVVRAVRDQDLVGVIAADEHTLAVAMTKLERRCKWSPPVAGDPTQTVQTLLAAQPSRDTVVRNDLLPPEDGEPGDAQTLTAIYSKPLIGHGSIGPSCGIALVAPGDVQVWSHSQNVFALREQVARVLQVASDTVRVRHQLAAGCYGHNGADDAAMDAVMLAQHSPGRPVRVQWTRKDELVSEPLGSPMRIQITATLSGGRISAWKLTTRSGTHIQRPGWNGDVNLLAPAAANQGFAFGAQVDLPLNNGGSKNAVTLYDFPQHVVYQFVPDLPFRLSALRSLGAFGNVFAIEGFMDELAEAADTDPVAFRLAHLSDERGRRVIQRAAELAGWSEPCPPGYGRGLGFARFKNAGTYCAVVALVAVEEEVELRGLWAAVDAGLAINPAGIVAQIEGGMLQAASWVLKEAVPTDGTRLTAETWKDYPILGFAEVPDVVVDVIAASEHASSGVGEASLGPTAGAIGNAVANALGIRMRDLPLTRDRIVAAMMEGA